MLVPVHLCWHLDPSQSSAALFCGATASLEADDAQHFLGQYLQSAAGLFLAEPLILEILAALHLLLWARLVVQCLPAFLYVLERCFFKVHFMKSKHVFSPFSIAF